MERQVLLLLPAFLLTCVGCKTPEGHTKKISDLWSQTVDVSNSALDQVSKLDSDEAKREFRKLSQFEYLVRSFPREVSTSELQSTLAALGQESWDCSPPLLRGEELLIVCKRKPESILRYIPQTLLGKP